MIKVIHDLIKIRLSREGYLPDYPPHLISDEEMCNAFIEPDTAVRGTVTLFHDYYPAPTGDGITAEITQAYNQLVADIRERIQEYLADDDPDAALPNWVYSYMLTIPISEMSTELDRHTALVTIGLDNIYDEMTPQVYKRCLDVSSQWVAKYGMARKPTVFIEPHVLKYFRLLNAI